MQPIVRWLASDVGAGYHSVVALTCSSRSHSVRHRHQARFDEILKLTESLNIQQFLVTLGLLFLVLPNEVTAGFIASSYSAVVPGGRQVNMLSFTNEIPFALASHIAQHV